MIGPLWQGTQMEEEPKIRMNFWHSAADSIWGVPSLSKSKLQAIRHEKWPLKRTWWLCRAWCTVHRLAPSFLFLENRESLVGGLTNHWNQMRFWWQFYSAIVYNRNLIRALAIGRHHAVTGFCPARKIGPPVIYGRIMRRMQALETADGRR